ncbi:MAG: hypothetical protein V4659_00245 [Pseudomonadota bacterium]
MARGDLTEFRVNPTLTETPRVDAPPAKSAAPQQIMQVGQALQQAGGAAGKIFEDQLREVNKARVTEAAVELTKREQDLRQGPNGYLTLKGKDALDRPDGKSLGQEYGETFDSDIQGIAKNLSNDAQRRAFGELATRMRMDFGERVNGYTFKQQEVYDEQVFLDRSATMADLVATNPYDDAITGSAINNLRTAISERADKMGLEDTDAVDNELKRQLSPGFGNAIDALLDAGEIESAKAYLDKHADLMTGAAQTQAYKAVNQQLDLHTGNQFADGLAAQVDANTGGEGGGGKPVAGTTWGLTSRPGEARDGGSRSHQGWDLQPSGGNAGWYPTQDFSVSNVRNSGKGGIIADVTLADGTKMKVMHLATAPREGQYRAGQLAVTAGKTGNAKGNKGPIVHVEAADPSGKPIDPRRYFTSGTAGGGGSQGPTGDPGSVFSYSQGVERIRESGLNPRQQEFAIKRLRENVAIQREVRDESRQNAVDAAMWALYRNGGDLSKVPPSILSRVQGSDLSGLTGFSNSMRERAEGKEPSREVSLQTYARVREGVANGTIRTPSDILREAPGLSQSDAKGFMDEVTKPKQSNIDSSQAAVETINRLKTEGIFTEDFTKDPKRFGSFSGAFYKAVAEQERAEGKPVSGDVRRAIAIRLLGETTLRGTKSFGRDESLPKYEVANRYYAIDPKTRNSIIAALRKRGEPVNQKTVLELYETMN